MALAKGIRLGAACMVFGLLLACGGSGGSGEPAAKPSRLKKGTLVKVYPQETTDLERLKGRWRTLTAGAAPAALLRDLEHRADVPGVVHTLVASQGIQYASTDDQDQDRIYSGRVFLPTFYRAGPHPVPLVVYAHGTELEREAAPFFNQGAETVLGAMAAYTAGFVVAMPDLPGMGLDASRRPHHYCHAKALANCVLDMVAPALASLDPARLRWDGRLFIMGYSEGGYAALAAVRELQTNPHYKDLRLTGSACMGGPFDFSGSVRTLLSEAVTPFTRPYIQAYLVSAYHDLYPAAGLFHPEQCFHPRLLESRPTGAADGGDIRTWLDGKLGGEAVTEKIKVRLKGRADAALTAREVLNPAWVETHLLHPSYPDNPLGRILRENDLVGPWMPRAPMLLAASPTDEVVPAENTHKLRRTWEAQGCQAKVEFYALTRWNGDGLDHVTGGIWALLKAFWWIRTSPWPDPPVALELGE